jgi:hypothetical protein
MLGDSMRLIPSLTLMLLVTACAPCASSTPTDSGIEGRVLIGPVCPVVIQGQKCPDQPYQAFLTILKLNGRVETRFETDLQGHFQIPLAPGE